ncbi:LysM peptidoglycan-binding domain-containing protein [Arthrobacter sp. I2-34]|uniref:LysM peptidoglycan-binding domain-containing protein n=1 Tax=Arthrobacter hankyongi TaxID=2904801 RepID=A0ABS9LAX7_9MICC|nr:LysM peptidoglycan-binding domain-containing protein [Arthrobacter hankyongi]MCG2623839.1 LysM peptidoglycan-binding domain-containing protein [Arthrobacter hankyongi]
MSDQRPTISPISTQAMPGGQPSRMFLSAAATAAIPAVVLSSAALALPAQAAEQAPRMALQPRLADGTSGPLLARMVPASQVAAQLPSMLRPASSAVPANYIVRSGDTVSAIAARYGLSTSKVLSLNGLRTSSIIYPGQKLKLTGTAARSAQTTIKASSKASGYTVRAGDTLSGIASRHGISLSKLLAANGLKTSSIIYPGQKLKLTGAAKAPSYGAAASLNKSTSMSSSYTVRAGDTLSGIASRHGISLSKLLSANGLKTSSIIYPGQKLKLTGKGAGTVTAAAKPAAQAATVSGSYTVKTGDTLSGIAARNGTTLAKLLSANGLKSSSIIYPGQKLKLTGKSTAATSATPAANAASDGASAATNATYTVRAGDTLSGIAERLGMGLSQLLAANGLSSSSTIYPGQTLKASGGTTSAASSAIEPLVPSTFLHYTYPESVVADANKNKALLLSTPQPTQAQMQQIVRDTAVAMGVDPALALAFAYQESGFQQTAVSPANAIGTMQVIPSSGEWASDLVGRKLNLLDPYDNAAAGVAIIRSLVRTSDTLDIAIASYYQGQYSVTTHGMYSDTKAYVKAVKAHMKNFR